MSKGIINNIREWLNTGAAIVAISAGIYGFCTLKGDNKKIRQQLDITTRIAIATENQVKELIKQTKILDSLYRNSIENTDINKIRFAEESMPYLGFRYQQNMQDFSDGGDQLVNIGSKVKILKVVYGKNNTYTINYFKNSYVENDDNSGLYLVEQESKPKSKRRIDFTITMENMSGIKYKQRIYSDSKDSIVVLRPIKIN